jgi:hypothetical protein
MSASNEESPVPTWGPHDIKDSSTATPWMSVGSATAAGHGDHPEDNADDGNATLSGSKIGPQKEDLEGEQMRAPGEGDVMRAQFNKKDAGWGEQNSLTGDLDRQKEEQRSARQDMKARRAVGMGIDEGADRRTDNQGLSAV